MILEIRGDVPDFSSVYVTCCNETKIIDSVDKTAKFAICDSGDIEVLIEEKPSKSNYSFISILLFLLTWPIQLVFNVLFMNTDSKWYKSVRAYSIKARVSVAVHKDTQIRFKLSETYYDKLNSIWLHPRFLVEPDLPLKISFEENSQSIRNEYRSYVKRALSAAMVVMLIFVLGLFSEIPRGNIEGIVILLVLIVALIVLVFWVFCKEYRRCKALTADLLNSKSQEKE